jgi:SAM-dependent methyltransferase
MRRLLRQSLRKLLLAKRSFDRVTQTQGNETSLSYDRDILLDKISKLENAIESLVNPYVDHAKEITLSNSGYCTCCDSRVQFRAYSSWFRDNYVCSSCGSIPRERALMYAIDTFYPDWKSFQIHESSPVNRGASAKLKRGCPGYMATQYFPDTECGRVIDGFRNENLENQTLADEAFDLVVTQDVFEHLFAPDKAFREIARTLRTGGALVATVPLVNKNRKSEQWAKLVDNRVVFLGKPDYHGNPVDPEGSPVTYRWGYDICERIYSSSGLIPMVFYVESYPLGIKAELIDVLVCRKV